MYVIADQWVNIYIDIWNTYRNDRLGGAENLVGSIILYFACLNKLEENHGDGDIF